MQKILLLKIQDSYKEKSSIIQSKLKEFKLLNSKANDLQLFEELTFCILAAGTSAKMALNSVCAIKDILFEGDYNQLKQSLTGYYRYPNLRAYHIVYAREYLKYEHNFQIRQLLNSFSDKFELRRYLALNKSIMGIGFKESSHFLRNVGYSGFAILDKHIINTLYQFELVNNSGRPVTEKMYLEIEKIMCNFADKIGIDIDHLDLLLWSDITGEILK